MFCTAGKLLKNQAEKRPKNGCPGTAPKGQPFVSAVAPISEAIIAPHSQQKRPCFDETKFETAKL